jgi:putative hemolysin
MEIAIILILILANGFFAASEIAVVSSRRGRLEMMAEAGRGGAKRALALMEEPSRFLSTVQVGITLIGTFAAAFGGANIAEKLEEGLATAFPALAPYAGTIALSLVVLAITYLSLILGELAPKRLALQNAEAMASFVAPAMSWLAWLASPVVSLLTYSTELVLRLLGRHNAPEAPITEADIIALVREGAEEGTVEEAEEDFITSVFTFSDRIVRSVMTPRPQVVAVEINTPVEEVVQMLRESNYLRLPVYEDTLDRTLGVLHVKDLLQVCDQLAAVDLRSLLRPPLYLIESQRAVAAFQLLKQSSTGLALVLDEYGQVAGLITLEDLLEELVGDIAGESDEPEEAIRRREDGSYLVDGMVPYDELAGHLHFEAVEDMARQYGFETVAGLMLVLVGRIPQVGDRVRWQDHTFEVIDMDGQRIDKILIIPPRLQTDKQQTEGVLASRAVLPPINEGRRKD